VIAIFRVWRSLGSATVGGLADLTANKDAAVHNSIEPTASPAERLSLVRCLAMVPPQ